MTQTKNKPHKRAQTVKSRRHRLHVPPGGSFTFTPTSMSQAMVDRLFWRAGFGPSAADRAAWTGKPLEEAVDALLNTPLRSSLGRVTPSEPGFPSRQPESASAGIGSSASGCRSETRRIAISAAGPISDFAVGGLFAVASLLSGEGTMDDPREPPEDDRALHRRGR